MNIPVAALASLGVVAASTPPSIGGRYLTQDGAGVVEVGSCGNAVCGRLVKILKAKQDAPRVDVNNPDTKLRHRPILGIAILSGLSEHDGEWRGTIYDPRNGKSYRSIVRRNGDGSLDVRGCIAFFCQHQHWSVAR